MATIKQIIYQTDSEGYDIDILLIRYASGYTWYESVITYRGRVISESNNGYYHPDDALDAATNVIFFDLEGYNPQQGYQPADIFLDEGDQQVVIDFEGYIIIVEGDEVKVSKQGAGEKSFKIQDLLVFASDDLSEFRHDPIGTVIELYEQDT